MLLKLCFWIIQYLGEVKCRVKNHFHGLSCDIIFLEIASKDPGRTNWAFSTSYHLFQVPKAAMKQKKRDVEGRLEIKAGIKWTPLK